MLQETEAAPIALTVAPEAEPEYICPVCHLSVAVGEADHDHLADWLRQSFYPEV